MDNIEKELSKYIYARLQDIADALEKGINNVKTYKVCFDEEPYNYSLTFKANNIEDCLTKVKKGLKENGIYTIKSITEIKE